MSGSTSIRPTHHAIPLSGLCYALIVLLSTISNTFGTTLVSAVIVEPAPNSIAEALDIIGHGLASKADERLKQEVRQYAARQLVRRHGRP